MRPFNAMALAMPAPSAPASAATPRAGSGPSPRSPRRAARFPIADALSPRRLHLLACRAFGCELIVGGGRAAAASVIDGGAQRAARGGGAATSAAAAIAASAVPAAAAAATANPEAGEPADDGGRARDAIAPVTSGTKQRQTRV